MKNLYLSPSQELILITFREFEEEHKRYPSAPELSKITGMDKSKVCQKLCSLERKKLIYGRENKTTKPDGKT